MKHNHKIEPMFKVLYESNRNEVKTVGEWINWATEHNAVIDCSSEKREVKILFGVNGNQVVLRELTKYEIDRIN